VGNYDGFLCEVESVRVRRLAAALVFLCLVLALRALVVCSYLGEDESLLPEEVFAGFDKFVSTVNTEMNNVRVCTCCNRRSQVPTWVLLVCCLQFKADKEREEKRAKREAAKAASGK
jgi:hypothetical protein